MLESPELLLLQLSGFNVDGGRLAVIDKYSINRHIWSGILNLFCFV